MITTHPIDRASTRVSTNLTPACTDPGSPLNITIRTATVSHGVMIELDGAVDRPARALGISCGDSECVEMVLDGEWPGVVPARTDLIISSWPAPGDECACAQSSVQWVACGDDLNADLEDGDVI